MNPFDQAIARIQIQTAMHRYATIGKENCDFDAAAKLFEADAKYRLPDGTVVPPSEMKRVVQGKEAQYIRHHITTIDINFVSDDEAESEAYFFAATNLKFTDHWGRWKDVFRKQSDGSWLIKERTIIVEGHDPNGWTAQVYGQAAMNTSSTHAA